MKRLILLLFGIVPALGAQSRFVPSDSARAVAHRLAGCYRLDDGPWRADSVHAGSMSTLRTPLSFELTVELLPGRDDIQSSEHPMFMVRDSTGQRAGTPFEFWQPGDLRTGTIRISYPMPFAGVALQLAPDGKDLVGVVTAFTDAIREGEPSEVSRPVRARRVECPAK